MPVAPCPCLCRGEGPRGPGQLVARPAVVPLLLLLVAAVALLLGPSRPPLHSLATDRVSATRPHPTAPPPPPSRWPALPGAQVSAVRSRSSAPRPLRWSRLREIASGPRPLAIVFAALFLLIGAAARHGAGRRLVRSPPPLLRPLRAAEEATGETHGNSALPTATNPVAALYEALVASIIRPPRAQYALHVLGPTEFRIDGQSYRREDYEVTNPRGQVLRCSEWSGVGPEADDTPRPYVVYLHGNASCRAEALDLLAHCLPLGLSVVSFDFAGCGHSEGAYVSLGHHEAADLAAVVADLRARRPVAGVVAWGRSMGAVTSLLFAASPPPEDVPGPTVDGLVIDSAFTSLVALSRGLAGSGGALLPFPVPGWLVSAALWAIGRTVRRRADFDIWSLAPVATVPAARAPAFFAHARDDSLIPVSHSQSLWRSYGGPRRLAILPGDHNSPRPKAFLAAAARFALQVGRRAPDPFGALDAADGLPDSLLLYTGEEGPSPL